MITDKDGKALTNKELLHKVLGRSYNILLEFEVFILHCIGALPIHWIRRLFYRMAGMRIGKGSVVHTGARFYNPQHITIGEDTIIGENAVLDGRENLKIGNHVAFASEVMVYNSEHRINEGDFKAIEAPVSIEDYVFVGPRAIILPGVTVGKGAVIAAGAVVTKDVAAFQIVGGVPAQVIGERKDKELYYRLGRARLFR